MDKNNLNNIPKDLFVPLVRKEDTSDKISAPSRTFFQDAKRTLFNNKPAVFSMILILLIIIMSIAGPWMNRFWFR